ncbi:piggyBac transposable element-derived protein 5-like [Schistocerca americana]|uniref:piggyBac transposable element-derived protein 5-like n=1 Tax=Schistocerca americana TaxID=7009 RepID=UPI001F4F683E|nr:piggyBac transposable element-derived protein 5-like [Schistocerca americana]
MDVDVELEALRGDEIILLLRGDDSELSDDKIVSDDERDYDPSVQQVLPLQTEPELDSLEEALTNDETLLSVRLETLGAGNANSLRYTWICKDLEAMDVQCAVQFSDPPSEKRSPLQYFESFIDETAIDNLVTQTNLYSTQVLGQSINTSANEMRQFIGIHLLSGIVSSSSYKIYWANETRYNQIADVIPLSRFYKLKRYLLVNDNANILLRDDPRQEKLFKVRPFLDQLKNNFLKTEVEEYNSIDELIILLKPHTSLRQYIKSKPHKWGMKVFSRAGVSGYIYDSEVCVGKGTNTASNPELGMSGNVVIQLIENSPRHANFKLFMDN